MQKNFLKIFSALCPVFFLSAGFAAARTQQLIPVTPAIGSLPELTKTILDVLIKVGIPVAAMFLIFTGYLFVTANGNETNLAKAKNSFKWTVIGIAVLLGAWSISAAIQGTIDQLVR